MSLLADSVLGLIETGVFPATDRGLVATLTFASVGLLATSVWLLITSADPLRQPEWALAAHVGAMLVGAGGLLVSWLHLKRNPSDQLLAILCLAANAAAHFAIPAAFIAA